MKFKLFKVILLFLIILFVSETTFSCLPIPDDDPVVKIVFLLIFISSIQKSRSSLWTPVVHSFHAQVQDNEKHRRSQCTESRISDTFLQFFIFVFFIVCPPVEKSRFPFICRRSQSGFILVQSSPEKISEMY